LNIDDLSVKLGVNVTANFLQPSPCDLLVLKVDAFLSAKQRELVESNIVPTFKALGCKVVVLEGGMDVLLIKQAAADAGAAAA
jgi:hypothetical protein